MFKRHRSVTVHSDLSARLRSEIRLWNVTPQASHIDLNLIGICTVCVDIPAQLFAVGTSQGEIRIYNGQFKETILTTGKPFGVKLLQFSRPRDLFKLLCIDKKHTLYVWNLDVHGIPVLQTSQTLDGPIYRISTCLSHSHALLATQSGDIVTFDLATLNITPYKVSPALKPQQNGPATDVVLLPHRLNHVLISYSTGTVLYDLLSREVIRSYTHALNDTSPSVTGLALHPVGQHFAAGFDDGTIGIWDVSSLKPLWVGHVGHRSEDSHADGNGREPVFKMEWILLENSDGSPISWLAILGGLVQSQDIVDGISVLGFDTACFHNTNMEFSSISPNPYLYPCHRPVQDFAIFPADATSTSSYSRIYIISGSGDQAVSVDAFQFPPRLDHSNTNDHPHEGVAVELEFSADLEESEERSRDLAATLEDLNSDSQEQESVTHYLPPLPVPLPLPMCVGTAAVLAADMVSLQKAAYLRLVRRPDEEETLNKNLQYRIMITQHEDASIRFHDVSSLAGVNLSLHPSPLDHLTIHVFEIPEIALRPDIHNLHIAKVAIASDSLECVVQMTTGEIVVLGLGLQPRTQDVLDDEIIDLSDVRDHGDIYIPRFIIQAQKGGPNILCLSDIGFLAVAFMHSLLLIIDLRGPTVILRDLQIAKTSHGEVNVVESLCWVISGVGDDNSPAPRLLVSRHDGTLSIFTLERSNNAWTVVQSRTARQVHALKAPLLSVVLDAQTGVDCRATPLRLANVLDSIEETPQTNAPHCFWVMANRREIRTNLNITGDKVSKVTLSSHDALDHISFVYAHDASVLVAFTRGRVIIYSLPALEAIHTFQLPGVPKPRDSIMCTVSGNIFETFRSSRSVVTIMFTPLLTHSNSSASGAVNFRHHKYTKTPSTEMAKSHMQDGVEPTWGNSISSWIKQLVEETPVTGDEIDQALAGPQEVTDVAEVATKSASTSSSRHDSKLATPAGSASLSGWGQGMYQQLTSAASERGERLGELQEHFQQLEAGSKDLVAQAKQLAEKQATRRWFL